MASQWFVGSEHEDLLEATRRQRKQRRDLEASRAPKGSPGPGGAGGPGGIASAQIPVHEVAARVRELLEDNFDDLYDAFVEVDASSNGRLAKAAFKDGLRILGASATQVPEAGLDELFDAIDVDQKGHISLKDFLVAFQKPDYSRKPGGRDAGGSLARKTGSAAKAEAREARIKRDFDEVLMECKDERGVQNFFAMPAMASFSEVLQRLGTKYGRPVTFLYEAEGHQYTVKNAKDLRRCWDSVEAVYHRSGSTQKTAHLDAFVVDYDASKAEASTADAARIPLAPPSKDRRAGEKESALSKLRHGAGQRDPVASVDFSGKHKWIDEMMSALGAPADGEPPTMQGRWDKLLAECRAIDSYGTGTVTAEGFRNALTRTEPRMSVDQTEWFVRDADKTEAGDVAYEKYIATKKVGGVGGGGVAQDSAVTAAETKINAALRQGFKSLQQAFRRMDADRDGRLSREEFSRGIAQRLKLRLAPRVMDAVVRRADFDGDGFIEYEDFLERYSVGGRGGAEGASDGMSDSELSRLLLQHHQGSVAKAFDDLDTDKDGRVSAEELYAGLQRIGLSLSHARVDRFMDAMDLDFNRFIDYREFLRQLSKVDLSLLPTAAFDALGREMQGVCERLREKFDDAKQAFHAFDADHDGRLSLEEFRSGVGKFVDGGAEGLLEGMFARTDKSGDGFVSYHEFLQSFGVKPKVAQDSTRDKAIREFLREKFPGSITAAFQALDVDCDNRLSKEDLREGLRALGMPLQDHEADALMRRADFDEDAHIDYLEFLVRFGLEAKAEGKWEYRAADGLAGSAREAEDALPFRCGVLPSRWHGRGGVGATLLRFDANKDGRLSRREVEAAFRDGLGMEGLTPSELDGIVGANFDKPFCDAKRGLLDVAKFVQGFVDVHCGRELAMFSGLLAKNRWLDLLHAFESFGSAGTRDSPLISKADFSAALQRLVDKGMIEASERSAIIAKSVEDGRFEQGGRHVGYIDYLNGFLRHYIGVEMSIHANVSPVWEDWVRQLDQHGGTLTHAQFREVCAGFSFGVPLTATQVEWLIDVIDADGDGTVSRSELVRRYARDDALLMASMREHWLDILRALEAARRPGAPPGALPRQDMQAALVRLCDANCMGEVSKAQIPELVASIDPALLTPAGEVLYEEWIRKYARAFFSVHSAFQGTNPQTRLPVWDAVISWFETVDASRGGAGGGGLVSWDHFRKVLMRAGVELDSSQVTRLIEHLDGNMSGHVRWAEFVRGVGADGDLMSAPYFFNGDLDLQMRSLMRRHWDDALTAFRRAIARVRKEAPGRIPPAGRDLLPLGELARALKESDRLRLADVVKEGRARENPLVKKVCEVALEAFTSDTKDSKGGVLIDCEAVCRYYAGPAYYAESLFERKWESVISVMRQLDVSKDGTVPREELERRLHSAELGLTDSMVDYLLQDQPASAVDYQEMCWRCGKPTIVKILGVRWSALMRGWRAVDKSGGQRLDAATFRSVLDRVDMGLSDVQVDMLMRHVLVEEDGRIDYHKVLSGKLKGCSYAADAYIGWRALEEHWESLADNFETMDSNADGHVTHNEFKSAVLQLRIAGLTESRVLEAILREVDPEDTGVVAFEQVTWVMLKEGLKESVGGCSGEIVDAFRNEASRCFSKHAGMLPPKDVETIVEEVAGKQHAVRRTHARLIAARAANRGDGMVSEAGLHGVLNELSGGQVGRADAERLRDDFAYLMGAARILEPDTWIEKGGVQTHPRELSGVCVLGGDALRCVGKTPHRRGHMLGFLAEEGEGLLPSMQASARLRAIHQYRTEKVYGTTPWKAFWDVRSQYSSPLFADVASVQVAVADVRASMLKKYQRGRMGPWGGGVGGRTIIEVASDKVKKHLMDVPNGVHDARTHMDPQERGVTTEIALRAWLLQPSVGLTEEEADALVRAEDPRGDGVVLYEGLLARLGPPKVDLGRLLQSRHARGSFGGGAGRGGTVRGTSLDKMYRDTAEQLRLLAGLREAVGQH